MSVSDARLWLLVLRRCQDELVCHGVPYSNLSSVARELRAGLGPDVLLVANDCAHSYTWSGGAFGWPAIPPEVDLVSADVYNFTNGTAEALEVIAFYERFIIPKLQPHQQALFCPGTFGCGPKFGLSFAEQQAQVVAKVGKTIRSSPKAMVEPSFSHQNYGFNCVFRWF